MILSTYTTDDTKLSLELPRRAHLEVPEAGDVDEPVCGDGGAADVSGEGEQVALAPLHLLAQQVAAPVPVLRLPPPLVADVSIHIKNITI